MTNAIEVSHITKNYFIGRQDKRTAFEQVRGIFTDPFKRIGLLLQGKSPTFSDDSVTVLNDISFDVKTGEVLGIIGANGAGKSTLLKILSGITYPTSGTAKLYGRVGSLLEVGTGFHAELTGRENVYLNGSILGMTRAEISKRFDEIVAFAGVEKFIDTPVKRYSSGMKVRLAFGVAAHLDPEILLIDEVLAVGDAVFQQRSLNKMSEITMQSRTVIFVSHQLDMIRAICTRCIFLDSGQIKADGKPEEVIDAYLNSLRIDRGMPEFDLTDKRSPELEIEVFAGRVLNTVTEKITGHFDVFDPISIELDYEVRRPVVGSVINFKLYRNGVPLFTSFDTDTVPERHQARSVGRYTARINIPSPLLKDGIYTVVVNAGYANVQRIQNIENALKFEVELISVPSAFVSYANKRFGVIAMPLDWQTVLTPTEVNL